MDCKDSDNLEKIKRLASKIGRDVNIMEVCGTHTQTIEKFGLRSLMPKNIRLISGPGCPVCVTPKHVVDSAVRLADSGVPIATYGDMMKVPGSFGSLDDAKARGGDVFVVESTYDAIKIKEDHPDIVFLAIGFETTTPMTAYAVKEGLDIICAHKTIPQAMSFIISDDGCIIDGFLDPGHVAVITGHKPFSVIDAPQVITGFEPSDVLEGICMLLEQIYEDRSVVENQYIRAVDESGNRQAIEGIEDVFEPCDSEWRGIGTIKDSGLRLKSKYSNRDAILRHSDILEGLDVSVEDPRCRCDKVITGKSDPSACPMFGLSCNPDNPIGPCMVGSEGACRIAYRYRRS